MRRDSGGVSKAEAVAVLGPLVAGHLRLVAVGAPVAVVAAGGDRRHVVQHPLAPGLGRETVGVEVVAPGVDVPRWPALLADPAAGALLVEGLRRYALLHPGAQPGLRHHPGVDALEPVIPPAAEVLQPVDRRAGLGLPGIGVGPRTDQATAGCGEVGDQARHRVGVAVGPAAHGIDRGLDVGVVLADRAVAPLGVAGLVLHPAGDQVGRVLQPLQPHLLPALADHLGVGRAQGEGGHGGAPVEVVVDQAAAHVVDVVGVAVIGRADRIDRLQRAAGASAATWRQLKPPQEIPIIPVAPVHQGCCASHSST